MVQTPWQLLVLNQTSSVKSTLILLIITLPKTNISPLKNRPFQNKSCIPQSSHLQLRTVSFRESMDSPSGSKHELVCFPASGEKLWKTLGSLGAKLYPRGGGGVGVPYSKLTWPSKITHFDGIYYDKLWFVTMLAWGCKCISVLKPFPFVSCTPNMAMETLPLCRHVLCYRSA